MFVVLSKICVLVSEELGEPMIVQNEVQGWYAFVFNPLRSLSDPCLIDIGGIFGTFRQLEGGLPSV